MDIIVLGYDVIIFGLGYDIKLHLMGRLQFRYSEVIGKVELPFNFHYSRLTLTWSGSTF